MKSKEQLLQEGYTILEIIGPHEIYGKNNDPVKYAIGVE